MLGAAVVLATAPAGSNVVVVDQFGTRNQFYGGQLGTIGTWKRGRWSIEGKAVVALGADDETIRRVGDFQEENPQGKHGAHQYTPEQYGFDPECIGRRFAAYTERFGIEPDRPRPGKAG